MTPTQNAGARLAGYRVWDPAKKRWRESKDPTLSMQSVFDRAFKYLLKHGVQKKLWLTQFRDKAQKLDTWWKNVGNTHVRCYAASLLLIWEGDHRQGAAEPANPVLKFIDFAHFHAHKNYPEWAADDTSKGLSTVVVQLERLLGLT